MKSFNLITTVILLSVAMIQADDKVWKARVTVEATDGTKTQSLAAFMPDDHAKLPIILGAYGQCTIEIQAHSGQAKKDQPSGYEMLSYSITQPLMKASDGGTHIPNEIFSVLLPVVFGKDQQLLKCSEGTVTVRLSGSEEKE